jgi:hypothetical protein
MRWSTIYTPCWTHRRTKREWPASRAMSIMSRALFLLRKDSDSPRRPVGRCDSTAGECGYAVGEVLVLVRRRERVWESGVKRQTKTPTGPAGARRTAASREAAFLNDGFNTSL